VIRTDHAALTHLKRTPEPLGQQARWLDLLAEYNFKIQHRAGTARRNSDALSRRPCKRDIDSECKQCRSKQRSTCFLLQGDEDSVVWDAAVEPPDHSEQVKLSEGINECICCRKAATGMVFATYGNMARVADQSIIVDAGTSAHVEQLVPRSAAGQGTERAAGLTRPVSQSIVASVSMSGFSGSEIAVAGPIAACLPTPPWAIETVAGQQTNRQDVEAIGAEGTSLEAEAEIPGRSAACWSDFPEVTGNVADHKQICQNLTRDEEKQESRCEAVTTVVAAGRSVACCPNLSESLGVTGQQASPQNCGASENEVASRRYVGNQPCLNVPKSQLSVSPGKTKVSPVSMPSPKRTTEVRPSLELLILTSFTW